VNDASERHLDHGLRKSIDEYRRLAVEVATIAIRAENDLSKDHYLALAKSLTDLADTLQRRQSKAAVRTTPTISRRS
jgi:hypothetical protein